MFRESSLLTKQYIEGTLSDIKCPNCKINLELTIECIFGSFTHHCNDLRMGVGYHTDYVIITLDSILGVQSIGLGLNFKLMILLIESNITCFNL